mgnify:CR=1 FL=1
MVGIYLGVFESLAECCNNYRLLVKEGYFRGGGKTPRFAGFFARRAPAARARPRAVARRPPRARGALSLSLRCVVYNASQ